MAATQTMMKISSREREILTCLSEGLTTTETAEKLHVTHETIKTHRKRLLIKFDARNAFQLGVMAVQYGVICA